MEKLRLFFKAKEYKVVLNNFLSLAVLQVLNIVLPLLTVPYLLRVVGVEKFGLISMALALVAFFQLVIEYGFNTVSARDVSVVAHDKKAVEQIFNEVMSTKLFLASICSVVFLVLIFVVPQFRLNVEVYLFTYIAVLGQALFPVWLFQGLQQMKYITYINVFFKTISTIFIFVLVRNAESYYLAPLLTSLGFLFSGFVSIILIKRLYNISFLLCSFKTIKKQLNKVKYLFFSDFQVALLANANVLLLGFLVSNTAVGYYATADKVIRALSNLQNPLINAFYPYISKLMTTDRIKAIQQIKKVGSYMSGVNLVGLTILFVCATYIFKLLFGNYAAESVIIFRIMILFPLLSFLDQLFGKIVLLINNREDLFFKVFFYTSLISVLLSVVLTYSFGFIGTAIGSAIAQLFLAFGMWYYAKTYLKE